MNLTQWGDFPAPVDKAASFEFGPLQLWLQILEGDLWKAEQHRSQPGQAPATHPPVEGWTRRAIGKAPAQLRFSPVFPDLPVMVRVESPLLLVPSDRVRLFVRCPLWVQVESPGDSKRPLVDAPSVVLTRSWYGKPVEGELSYWLSSSARRHSSPDPDKPHMALCPIQIVNRSDEDLQVETILLRVPWLTLYRDSRGFWADTTRVAFRGSSGPSEVEVAGRAPSEADNARLLSKPRQPAKKGIASTFASFTKETIRFWDLFS